MDAVENVRYLLKWLSGNSEIHRCNAARQSVSSRSDCISRSCQLCCLVADQARQCRVTARRRSEGIAVQPNRARSERCVGAGETERVCTGCDCTCCHLTVGQRRAHVGRRRTARDSHAVDHTVGHRIGHQTVARHIHRCAVEGSTWHPTALRSHSALHYC